MQFILQAGLTLRDGARILELTRQLDRTQFVLEDVLTRKPEVMDRAVLLQKVYAGTYQINAAQRLEPGAQANQDSPVTVDLTALSQREKLLLELRFDYVKALERRKVTRGKRAEIAKIAQQVALQRGDKQVPSASAVMEWARKYLLSDRNPLALVDRYRLRKVAKRLDPRLEEMIWKALRKHYFTRDKYSLRHAFDQLEIERKRAQSSGELPAELKGLDYGTLARRVKDVDLYHRVATREGSARARMVCRTAFPEGHPQYVLQRVEIDHTPLNWIVVCDRTGLPLGRPTLTVMLDAFSGYVLGFYLSFYGAGLTSVAGVIKSALKPRTDLAATCGVVNEWFESGIGDEWVIDNGLEFHSFGFKMMAMSLGVDLMYCRVRTPWLKPRVERFFSTLNTLTLAKGRISKRMANVTGVNPYKDAAITFTDLVKGLTQFIVDIHPFEPNWHKMATPYELMKEGLSSCPPARYSGSLEQLNMAAAMSKTLTFGQGGIELMGLSYGSYDFKDLANKYGTGIKVLCKWDPDDISRLYVKDPKENRWILADCRCRDYVEGLSYNQHRLIRSFAKAELKQGDAMDRLREAKKRLHDHWMDSTSLRRRADAQMAGRFVDHTSHKVLEPSSQLNRTTDTPTTPFGEALRLVLPGNDAIEEQSIPDFESFSF